MYEKTKLDNAQNIIDKSFTYGAKLQRNPMTNAEKDQLAAEEREEDQRYELYKRAWFLRKKKALSIGGYITTDKNEFMLDWDEMVAKKQKALENKRN